MLPQRGCLEFSQTAHATLSPAHLSKLGMASPEPLSSSHMYSLNEDLIPPKGLLLGTSREYVYMGIISKGLEGPTSFNRPHPQQCSQELKGHVYVCGVSQDCVYPIPSWGLGTEEIVALVLWALQRVTICINCCCNNLLQTGRA